MLLDREQLNEMFTRDYSALLRRARLVCVDLREEHASAEDVVTEAWLRLAGAGRVVVESRLHFRRLVAQVMRRVLIDAARRRGAIRRGGGTSMEGLDAAAARLASDDEMPRVVSELLGRFGEVHPRQARVVGMRFVAGFNVSETARLTGTSAATVDRDCRFARSWLAGMLADPPA